MPTTFRVFFFVLLLFFPTALHAQTDNASCLDCHDDPTLKSDDGRAVGLLPTRFAASVHGDFDCVDCHTSPGDYEDSPHYEQYVAVRCAECHEDEWADYSKSVHRIGRLGVPNGGATCVSCHGTHEVAAVADTVSIASRKNIPNLCGGCHGREASVTKEFVRLPVAVPNYLASVHGQGWLEGKDTAVCTDCHGAHDVLIAQNPESHVNRRNISTTCSRCHASIAAEYDGSIHGQALSLGIKDSPTCTDCHNEHLIRKHSDPAAKVNPEHRAKQLCGNCHTDPELLSKFGITAGVVETYLDSYHGWAVDRGSRLAATCTDCHTVHGIRSALDPLSSVHPSNVAETCGRCHKGSDASFAQSYTHASALQARGAHVWVRWFYLGLIAVVLGGMVAHNLVVARYEFTKHLRRKRREPYVIRWLSAERTQHLLLLLSFTGLALTGFALRYPNAWWVQLLGLGGHEGFRGNLHRVFAVSMIAVAAYHTVWFVAARRGRSALREMRPRLSDFREALQNVLFHLGLQRNRPAFGTFDYTQKLEYWAVVWGTVIMALTGFILWYPTIATHWMPTWVIRVSEVVHYYEAILAVSAIIIWHFFYVIFMPSEYPMSTVWLDGRMSAEEWKETHRGEYERVGEGAVRVSADEREGAATTEVISASAVDDIDNGA